MERREVGIPHTRQKSSEGHRRALPNLGATGLELRRVSLDGILDPETPADEVRDHLLGPRIYGPSFRPSRRQSRNSGIIS